MKTEQRYDERAAALGLRVQRYPRSRFGRVKIDLYVRGGGKLVGTTYDNCGLRTWLNGYEAGKAAAAANYAKGFDHGAAS